MRNRGHWSRPQSGPLNGRGCTELEECQQMAVKRLPEKETEAATRRGVGSAPHSSMHSTLEVHADGAGAARLNGALA
ncbi:hypothetical protein PC123_g27070 [Phytophthora cactorum]|nr:hypothetical protein PC120_g25147 [Phytophthora cactorum]KAG4037364.1 hypothetical protein PC123_g27070 [Phytophthora cactorum]